MSQRLAVGALIASATAVALLFLVSMLDYTGGGLSAPLDDSFIYFQYARQLAEGDVFEYTDGAGFSTGATSLAYPVVLALGDAIGLSGDRLIGFAYVLATLGLIATALLAHAVLRPLHGERAALAAGLLVVANGWLLWGYLSMMEAWLYGSLLLATVWFLSRAGTARWEWPAAMGAAALLVFARPEAMLVGFAAVGLGLLAIARARAARSSRTIGHPAWALLPFASAAVYFAFVRIGSGSFTTNGYALKSVLSDAYLSGFEKAGLVGENFIEGGRTLFEQLGPTPVGAIAFGLALLGAASGVAREWQRDEIGVATATAALLLVGLAGASQGAELGVIHARYIIALAPLAAVLIVLGLWEIGSLAGASEAARAVAAGALIALIAPGVLSWASTFGENSAEVYLQHREAGLWLRDHTPEDALIAVNDAGALAYYSDRRVYDLAGLVTNDQARWFREGWGSVYESIERLPPDERPDYFAVFPGWFPFIETAGDAFEPLFAARLEERRITGGDELVVYRPHYAAFVEPRVLGLQVADDIDVADLESEADHGYAARSRQTGIRFAEHQATERKTGLGTAAQILDGGRIVSRSERFHLEAAPNSNVVLRARLLFPEDAFDDDASPVNAPFQLDVSVNGTHAGTFPATPPTTIWTDLVLSIPASLNRTGRLEIEVSVDPPWSYESYHYWLVQ